MMNQFNRRSVSVAGGLLLALLAQAIYAQTGAGTLTGVVTDPSGAAVPKAMVTATGAGGAVKAAETTMEGKYTLALPAGAYTVRASAPGFALFEKSVEITIGARSLDIPLVVTLSKQEVTVKDDTTGSVSVDPSQNAGALVLRGADLDALSDDPDDLASDLQALAGPAAGPNGGQIYIDGFTGGRLPPKSSIREVRINQNPFSAEYDRLGFGRIEILTKPGTDKLHGQGFFNFGDSALNSRNPFLVSPQLPSYQQKMFGGNLSGRLSKKSSFFVDAERRAVDEVAVLDPFTLDSGLNPIRLSEAVLNPSTRTTVSPRIDYQLTPNNTLVARFTWAQVSQMNSGLSDLALPSRAFDVDNTEHTVQLTETAVLNARTINETRFQFIRRTNNQIGDNSQPSINVLGAFLGGGATFGQNFVSENHYELYNSTARTFHTHLLKFGGRLRGVTQADQSTSNYNGSYTFTSLDAYRITQMGLQNGWTPDQIRAAGGGASQFILAAGNPLANVSQYDLGLFVTDDWRVKPNFTLSLGLRYEGQNNIGDHADIAPRIGFAWGIGKGSGRSPKTVVRGGFGLFYDRFSEDLSLEAIRFNGVNQRQFIVPFPDFYPSIPPVSALEASRAPLTIHQVYSGLRAPYIAQAAIGVERQLPKNITVAVNYTNSRGVHMLRSRNINAPLPDSGLRPYGDVGNIYLYESSGVFRQQQLLTNVNARVNARVSLFGFFVLGDSHSNTDGAGTFPANTYDLSNEYSRAAFDARVRTFIGGSLTGPHGVRLNPFIQINSGAPFNIVTGRDVNGDSVYTDRPAFATDLTRASVRYTPWGVFDTDPLPGQTIIPRNYGDAPGQFTVNMRLSKTFGFGERSAGPPQPDGGEGRPGPRMGGPGGPGGGRPGGGFGGRGGGGGGPRGGGGFGEGASGYRYSLILSVNARNVLNHVNPGAPINNLSSALFGTSTGIAGGGFQAAGTANRRIELSLRFMF